MAATGTPTPNLGLRIPIGTDPASVDDINYNSNLLDTKLGAVGNDSVQDQIDALNGNKASAPSNTIIRYGQVTVDAGTDRKSFSFGHTFSSPPRILLTPINDGNGGVVFTSFDIQTTRATALLRTGTLSNDQHIDWIAIGS